MENSGNAVLVFTDFPLLNRNAVFPCTVFDYSSADWDGFHYHLRVASYADIFSQGASVATFLSTFYLLKHQLKPHLSLWFSTACAGVTAHTNLFCMCDQIKFSVWLSNLGRLVTVAKGFLNLPKLLMLIKQMILSSTSKLSVPAFCKLLILFLTGIKINYSTSV